MIGCTIIKLVAILFNTFFLLWITSFIDKGIIKDDAEAKEIMTKINVLSVLASVVVFKVGGHLTDKYPPHVVIPAAFIFRAVGITFFF